MPTAPLGTHALTAAMSARRPLAIGSLFALAAAIAFGTTTPVVQRAGHGVGPFATATLLYAGAALFSARPRFRADAPLRATDASRLLAVSVLGAVIAPALLAWGLARTSGVTASLLLNTEAVFTVLLAWLAWREPIGARVACALGATGAAGMLLIAYGRETSVSTAWGAIAVAGATLAWALDNVVSRPLADRDATRVVLAKASTGTALSFLLARALGEAWPLWRAGLVLVGCGAIGYGASLDFYLRAQRRVGAARTGSIFAAAPFIGAAFACALGERTGGVTTVLAGVLCAIGVALQVTEAHGHHHEHEHEFHEHAHSHGGPEDDGHHDHAHPEAGATRMSGASGGVHSHPHEHARTSHAHAHGQDVHHRHDH